MPKCGGTTIEVALENSGYNPLFLDRQFWKNQKAAWYKTSPQHIQAKDIEILLGFDYFDYSFSVVRDPISRFLSAFNHNRRKIGRHIGIGRFLSSIESSIEGDRAYRAIEFDNHFVPATHLIPKGTKVFMLEDGMENILEHVGRDLGIKIDLLYKKNEKQYDEVHISRFRSIKRIKQVLYPMSPKEKELSPDMRERIRALYADDYLIDTVRIDRIR